MNDKDGKQFRANTFLSEPCSPLFSHFSLVGRMGMWVNKEGAGLRSEGRTEGRTWQPESAGCAGHREDGVLHSYSPRKTTGHQGRGAKHHPEG